MSCTKGNEASAIGEFEVARIIVAGKEAAMLADRGRNEGPLVAEPLGNRLAGLGLEIAGAAIGEAAHILIAEMRGGADDQARIAPGAERHQQRAAVELRQHPLDEMQREFRPVPASSAADGASRTRQGRYDRSSDDACACPSANQISSPGISSSMPR